MSLFNRSLLKKIGCRLQTSWRTVQDGVLQRHSQITYAQMAEDRLIELFFSRLNIQKPSYLDIGAAHPKQLSNTYWFYLHGGRGILVEPDPDKYRLLKKIRPHDQCIPMGVGTQVETQPTADFYLMQPPGLNTFCEQTMQRYLQAGHRLRHKIRTPLIAFNTLLAQFQPWPNLVSVDVEGLEDELLQTIDFQRFRPEVYCIETLRYPHHEKNLSLKAWMHKQGYVVMADTIINTLFVPEEAWARFCPKANPLLDLEQGCAC